MPTTTEFLNSSTPEEFKALLTVYHDALQIKAMLKNKKQGESLESLDKLVWFLLWILLTRELNIIRTGSESWLIDKKL